MATNDTIINHLMSIQKDLGELKQCSYNIEKQLTKHDKRLTALESKRTNGLKNMGVGAGAGAGVGGLLMVIIEALRKLGLLG